MSEPLASIESREEPGRTLVSLTGEIDLSNAEELRRELQRIVAEAPGGSVAIDLNGVGYMDSQGVRLVHRLARASRGGGAQLVFVATAGSVAGEILALTGVNTLVPVRESLDD